MREILAALETVYREPFPHLNLRQWSGAIYTWLTQPVLDPTSSGRVTMDYLMKLVTTALEWSHAAGETDVRAETLQAAAELLVLRRDTFRIIDGAGPSIQTPQLESTAEAQVSEGEAERVSSSSNLPEKETQARTSHPEMVEHAPSAPNTHAVSLATVRDQKQPAQTTKCTFSGMVPIEAKRFLDSGTLVVECPECVATRSLELRKGVLRFPSHDKRKTSAPNAQQRWVIRETNWVVVGG